MHIGKIMLFERPDSTKLMSSTALMNSSALIAVQRRINNTFNDTDTTRKLNLFLGVIPKIGYETVNYSEAFAPVEFSDSDDEEVEAFNTKYTTKIHATPSQPSLYN